MKFLTIFALRIKHLYYADNRCRDLQIKPTAGTERFLKNQRCIMKPLPDGIQVVTPVDDKGDLLISMPGNAIFAFRLRLVNPDFPLFTEMEEITSKSAPLFTNEGLKLNSPVSLSAKPSADKNAIPLTLRGRAASNTEVFLLREQDSNASFILGGRPLGGIAPSQFTLQGLDGNPKIAYDPGKKEITVNVAPAPKDRVFTVSYPVEPRLGRGVFAEVEIHNNESMHKPGDARSEFQIWFEAKKAKWIYYFVTDLSAARGAFAIAPDQSALNLKFSEAPADDSDTLARILGAQYPKEEGFSLNRFVSDESVSCQETATRGLRLKQGDQSIFDALPNPAIRNFCTVQGQDGFFQVVKKISDQKTQTN
jgi:hypothetical protein